MKNKQVVQILIRITNPEVTNEENPLDSIFKTKRSELLIIDEEGGDTPELPTYFNSMSIIKGSRRQYIINEFISKLNLDNMTDDVLLPVIVK